MTLDSPVVAGALTPGNVDDRAPVPNDEDFSKFSDMSVDPEIEKDDGSQISKTSPMPE